MQAAGFAGVFCNIGDHPASEWEAIIRPRALERRMFCGPWLRTQAPDGTFSSAKLDELVAVAERWGSPLIVNAESELKGTGSTVTTLIAERVAGLDAAVSMEPWPFANVDWTPLADIPVLPQLFGVDWGIDARAAVDEWHAYGVECVFCTFGTYGGSIPLDYTLQAPYSLYTGDDCGGDYARWGPTSYGYVGCLEPEPDNGGLDVTRIGSQDGVTAAMNRLRELDPGGTSLVKDAKGKYPPVETLTIPLDQQKAWDKLERTLTILVDDHDAGV